MKTESVKRMTNNLIECPLCEGKGEIDVTRLGIEKKTKKLAVLTAEETIQKLDVSSVKTIQKIKDELEDKIKSKYENELEKNKRGKMEAEIKNRELETQLTQLRTKMKESISIKGGLEEKDFIEEATICYPHFQWSEKLSKYGDYTATLLLKQGKDYVNTGIIVLFDNKSGRVTNRDVKKIIRDAKYRKISYAFLIAKDYGQLRNEDKRNPVKIIDNVLLVIGVRRNGDWKSKLDVLKPYIERDYINQKTRLERGEWESRTKNVLRKVNELSDLIQNCNDIEDWTKKIKKVSLDIRETIEDAVTEIEKILSEKQ